MRRPVPGDLVLVHMLSISLWSKVSVPDPSSSSSARRCALIFEASLGSRCRRRLKASLLCLPVMLACT
eukprot:2352036-Amphidinium_carterae.3